MTDAPKRRSLLADLDTTTPALEESAIAAAAIRNGFGEPTAPALMGTVAVSGGPRRHRQPTGRVHQLNVRLRADTIESIYAQANGRNVPVAQIIEEAMAALLKR